MSGAITGQKLMTHARVQLSAASAEAAFEKGLKLSPGDTRCADERAPPNLDTFSAQTRRPKSDLSCRQLTLQNGIGSLLLTNARLLWLSLIPLNSALMLECDSTLLSSCFFYKKLSKLYFSQVLPAKLGTVVISYEDIVKHNHF